MNRKKTAVLISVAVTALSVVTMSGVGIAAIVDMVSGGDALPCDQVPGTPQSFEGDRHIPYDGAPHKPYRTVPPTSGPHSPRVVGPGIYREPVAEELQVHALEHGHVLVQYAPDISAEDIRILERIGRQHPRDVVVAPYPPLEHGIGLTGWQRLQRLDTLDEQVIVVFITKVSGRYDHGWKDGATECL